jgi:hypothetical protein
VPTAGRKAAKKAVGRSLLVQVKRLRVVLGGEGLDRGGVDRQRAGGEGLADGVVLEVLLNHGSS